MATIAQSHRVKNPAKAARRDLMVVCGIALADGLLHMGTNGRYGFHRDELQFLSDARHLAWGYVSYPPLTPFVEHIGLRLFGLSLVGLRLFSVIAQMLALVFTGLMARELGGGRVAQMAATLAMALSLLPMFEATEFQYTSFEYLCWVLIAYFVVRLLKSEDPRWWAAIGAAAGVGLMTKYTILFFLAGVVAGVVFTDARRWLRSGWFWAGVGLALLIVLPNLAWQARHDFISYEFLKHIHARDVGEGRARGFWKDQAMLCVNPVAAPMALMGLVFFLRERRYRMMAWMWLTPVAVMFLAKGRGYYTAGAYPMLVAAGAVSSAELLRERVPKAWRRAIAAVWFAGLATMGGYFAAAAIPFAASGPLRDYALRHNGDLREEIGWDELVRTVAAIRDGLTPEQRAHLGITVGNYGEQGAIEMLGAAYGLPAPISTTNSAWYRGYPTPQPTTIIVLGLSEKNANRIFAGCRWAGHNGNALGVRNEESREHPDIFVCGPPRQPWPRLWKEHRDFG